MAREHQPEYRRQPPAKGKQGARAFVWLNGQRCYLGEYGSPESYEKYHRLLAEWSANGRHLPVAADEITVLELTARFWNHAKVYYVKPDGTQTSEVSNFKQVIKVLTELYAETKVSEFGPLALKATRQRMIEKKWSRKNINKQIGRLKMIFRWGTAEELVSATVYQALLAVPGLKRGRCTAKETPPIVPVPETHIEAIHDFVSSQIWALVQLALLTSARSGELVSMKPRYLNRSGPVWTYSPVDHKTAHYDHARTIFIGPRGQAILAPFLVGRGPDDFIFSPEEAEATRLEERHAQRTTPLSCGNRPGTNRVAHPANKPGHNYRQDSFRRAIQRACAKAGVPRWHPHQLRHNAATRLREEFDLEISQIMLGHSSINQTLLYAQASQRKARAVAVKAG